MEMRDDMASDDDRMRVLVAGGGVAGLEAVLALSALARDLVQVDVISPDKEFVYRPMLVAEPFGAAEVLRIDLEEVVADAGARHIRDALSSVNPADRVVETGSGELLSYDALIIAVGARPLEAVPGALSFSGAAERRRFAEMLKRLGRRGAKRLVFIVPKRVSWSIAAYELALLTGAERDARRLPDDVELVVLTHESEPLEVFGPAVSQLVASRLEEAGITLKTGSVAERVENGELTLGSGQTLVAGGFVALPTLEVAPIAGIPQRTGGFIQTDARMHVAGLEAVWAAGDATWFPIKQGGLAAQQSDAAARAIAARAGAHVPVEPFHPVLRAALITGEAPEFVRSDLSEREGSEAASGHALWWPATKIAGSYLSPYIANKLQEGPTAEQLVDRGPSAEPTEDAAEHELALGLVLAAADADATAGDFEGALKWLSLVEQLDFVVPALYVTRRYEWRRELEPGLEPDVAAARIDPSFESGDAAMRDLSRRVGWLKELGERTEEDMSDHLAQLDAGMEQLRALTKRAGIFKGSG
jgi:sulfide:quinone oxidoreductase